MSNACLCRRVWFLINRSRASHTTTGIGYLLRCLLAPPYFYQKSAFRATETPVSHFHRFFKMAMACRLVVHFYAVLIIVTGASKYLGVTHSRVVDSFWSD
eukprot:scaffold1319_cov126-Cylindrotheca_fusiformis.AAC.36